MASYEKVATLVSKVRNARYGEMVSYLETLIDSGDWRDFSTPAGMRFQFRECEFDYFLLALEVDPAIVRHAYLYADDVDGLLPKQLRLADLTGRGKVKDGARRPWKQMVEELEGEPSGAAARIRAAHDHAGSWFVTQRTGEVARDPARRRTAEQGKLVRRDRPNAKVWRVRWSDDKSIAEAITEKLLVEPSLAQEVYKQLDSRLFRRRDPS
ncbi:hypothetical protein CIW52_01920 [Mycolicibacterium sp. P9-64]|uniref:hypothetical protein n=1 Tax=Mycolicibacterium sp. P9-64 TaxID=2024612 RepID=UPI0011EC44C5|nr:hypothetical protein [Mycolicibacterium sp. P9-64]KAA0086694.1 hypothetical protein CIW52_01920 [Mycolicibacterium sp. P9-64]